MIKLLSSVPQNTGILNINFRISSSKKYFHLNSYTLNLNHACFICDLILLYTTYYSLNLKKEYFKIYNHLLFNHYHHYFFFKIVSLYSIFQSNVEITVRCGHCLQLGIPLKLHLKIVFRIIHYYVPFFNPMQKREQFDVVIVIQLVIL